jgi:hypothetical protein
VRSDEAGATEDEDLLGGVATAKRFDHNGRWHANDSNMDYVGTNDLFTSVETVTNKALDFKETFIPAPNGAYFGEPDRIRIVTLDTTRIGSRSK